MKLKIKFRSVVITKDGFCNDCWMFVRETRSLRHERLSPISPLSIHRDRVNIFSNPRPTRSFFFIFWLKKKKEKKEKRERELLEVESWERERSMSWKEIPCVRLELYWKPLSSLCSVFSPSFLLPSFLFFSTHFKKHYIYPFLNPFFLHPPSLYFSSLQNNSYYF